MAGGKNRRAAGSEGERLTRWVEGWLAVNSHIHKSGWVLIARLDVGETVQPVRHTACHS